MPENPHTYDDDAYLEAVIALGRAVGKLWEAGLSAEEIEREWENALENSEAFDGD